MIFKVVLGFFRGMWTLAPPWRVWIALLILVNGIAPLFYIATLEGRVVLAAFLAGATLQMIIFRAKGFVRLLGLGHILWIPMLLWLWGRLALAGTGDLFGKWLAAVIVLDALALSIDVVDVVRYGVGERQANLTVEDL